MLNTSLDTGTLLLSAVGGILPALAWLWFWLREDKMHPEPRSRLLVCFLAGMVGVVIAYFAEQYSCDNIAGVSCSLIGLERISYPAIIFIMIAWSAIEELLKYGAAGFTALLSKDFDEPVDGLVYMITAALGFSALENAMFLLGHITDGGTWLQTLATGQMRFIGASLLHVISSSAIGYAAAKSFFLPRKSKIFYRLIGVLVAITLHTFFNLFIIQGNDRITFAVFGTVWVVVIVLLLLFEKVKKISN
jgi:protease PrsW